MSIANTIYILNLTFRKKFYREDINIIQLNYVLSLIFALISFLLLTISYFTKIKLQVSTLFVTFIQLLTAFTSETCLSDILIVRLRNNCRIRKVKCTVLINVSA